MGFELKIELNFDRINPKNGHKSYKFEFPVKV